MMQGEIRWNAVSTCFPRRLQEKEPMTAMDITELEQDIERKQRALARAKRDARLAPIKEKTNAEALAEFGRTGQVPQSLAQEIERAFDVKTSKARFIRDWDDKELPGLTFRKGNYEYAVVAEIIGNGGLRNPHRLCFELTKQNRDRRIWHDKKCANVYAVGDVVGSLRKLARHVAETEEQKLSRLYTPDDPVRGACEQLRSMNVLPVGAYPVIGPNSVRYRANGEEIRLSRAIGKIRWGGWIRKEEGEKITFVDVNDKHAAKIIRSFFKKPVAEAVD
jgi:hypothetical protein